MSDTTNTTENMEQVTEQEKEMQEAQASGVVNFDDKKKDKEEVEQELADQNKYALSPEISSAFQCILAAKAAGVASDEIRRLPVGDYMKIKNKARDFLIAAGY